MNETLKSLLLEYSQDRPKWTVENIAFLVIHGSRAYGTSTEASDYDFYGFTIPPKEYLNPFNESFIYYFDDEFPKFEQTVLQHLPYENSEADFQIYNIVKFFKLCMGANPNMVDCLYVPEDCHLVQNEIQQLILENRRLFLSQKLYHTFRGYGHAQLKKCKSQTRTGKRKESVDQYGYDLKFANHIFRLYDECEQLLLSEDMDIQRNKDECLSIKNGEWALERVEEEVKLREARLDVTLSRTKLPKYPNKDKIRELLKKCLNG